MKKDKAKKFAEENEDYSEIHNKNAQYVKLICMFNQLIYFND